MTAQLEVVQAAFEAFSSGDYEGWVARLHPDVEWVTDELAGPTSYRGHPGVRQWLAEVSDGLGEIQLEVHELRAAGGCVFVAFDIHARGRTSGIAGSVRRGAVVEVLDDKIAYYRSYLDERDARAAAGLPPG